MWILGLKGLRHNNTDDIGSDVRGDAGGNARNNAGGTADIAARGNGGMQCWQAMPESMLVCNSRCNAGMQHWIHARKYDIH